MIDNEKKAKFRKLILDLLFGIWAAERGPKQPSPNPHPHIASQHSDSFSMEKYSFSLIKDPKTCLDLAGSQMYKIYGNIYIFPGSIRKRNSLRWIL